MANPDLQAGALAKPSKGASLIARFWLKVQVGEKDHCWPWLASTDRAGYGQFGMFGTMRRAPRVAYEFWNSTVIESVAVVVLHSCDNPACCNPHHLSLGTQADNLRDMAAKGRARGGSQPAERNPSAVLKTEQVLAIRVLLGNGTTTREVARRFGVSRGAVSKIRTGRTWKAVA